MVSAEDVYITPASAKIQIHSGSTETLLLSGTATTSTIRQLGGNALYRNANTQYLYGGPTDMRFVSNDGGTVNMTVMEGGKVGIGTGAPAYKLDVRGDTLLSGAVYIDGSTKIVRDTSSDGIVVSDSGGNLTQITAKGLILSENPTYDIANGGQIWMLNHASGANTQTGYLAFQAIDNASNTQTYSEISGAISSDATTAESGFMDFNVYHTGSNETVMRMVSGNVGIGTTSPTQTLDVRGTTLLSGTTTITSGSTLWFNDAGTAPGTLRLRALDGNTMVSGSTDLHLVASDDLTLKTGGGSGIITMSPDSAELIRLHGADAMIGTSAALGNGKLTIVKSGQPQLTVSSDATNYSTLEQAAGTGGNLILTNHATTGDIRIDPNDDLWLDSKWIRYYNEATATEYARISHNENWITEKLIIKDSAGNTDILFETDGDDSYIANGDFGLGTTDPDAKLDVRGTTILSGTTTVHGTLSATAKSFDIPHPDKKGMRLIHGSLEGPEHGVYVRGTAKGHDETTIELPDYWETLVGDDYTLQLTSYNTSNVYIVDKGAKSFTVNCNALAYKFDYFVIGRREEIEVEIDGN